jgi:hypothetical protein
VGRRPPRISAYLLVHDRQRSVGESWRAMVRALHSTLRAAVYPGGPVVVTSAAMIHTGAAAKLLRRVTRGPWRDHEADSDAFGCAPYDLALAPNAGVARQPQNKRIRHVVCRLHREFRAAGRHVRHDARRDNRSLHIMDHSLAAHILPWSASLLSK